MAYHFKYIITAPLFYLNSLPHIGHIYSLSVADCINRYMRSKLMSNDTYLLTGFDEHGTKIQHKAIARGETLDGYCNSMAHDFTTILKGFNLTTGKLHRTTDPNHEIYVHDIWRYLTKREYIYPSTYEGWYSIPEESFISPSQIVKTSVDGQEKCFSANGDELTWLEEKCYKFKFTRFKADINDWLLKEKPVVPEKFNNDAINMLKNLDDDLTITRPTEKVFWGIYLPNQPDFTIYVWFDALISYFQIPHPYNEKHSLYQQLDCQVFGKDILKFHAIYWPAILTSLGKKLPKKLVCHSHWLSNDTKMSKSKGNVVSPVTEARLLTHEGLRYYLLRTTTLENDTSYNRVAAINCVNSELLNKLVNLLYRSTSHKLNPNQIITTSFMKPNNRDLSPIIEKITSLSRICERYYDSLKFHSVVDSTMSVIDDMNKLYTDKEPWNLIKDLSNESQASLNDLQTLTFEVLRICSIILIPIIPELTNKVLDRMRVPRNKRFWANTRYQIINGNPRHNYRHVDQSIERIIERQG